MQYGKSHFVVTSVLPRVLLTGICYVLKEVNKPQPKKRRNRKAKSKKLGSARGPPLLKNKPDIATCIGKTEDVSDMKLPETEKQLICSVKDVQKEVNKPQPQQRETEKAKSKKSQNVRGARAFQDKWLVATCKGHTGAVSDMNISQNGKQLISCADDRTVVLWDIKDLFQKDRKSLRINVEFDHATFVKWSPDSKAFIITKYSENTVEVYKLEKKKDGWFGHATKAFTFAKVHVEDVIAMDIACHGKFIMTCSNKTDMIVWDLKGQELARVDTYLMNTNCAKISPCGKFIVASGFAPDVKVWEVMFAKTGDFQEVKRVFELSGHTSGVYDFAFDVDTSHIATISKDGTWKIFDTKIDYKKGEDPHLLISRKYEQASQPSKIALSPDAEVVVIATGGSISFYNAKTGDLDRSIDDIYSGGISAITFDSTGKYVYTSGDKFIRVFHNVTGYKCGITSAKDKLKQNQTSATKERLQKLIVENEKFINEIEINA